MEEKNNACPCCGKHCDLSAPSCERGTEYVKTGVIPERSHDGSRRSGEHDHHGHRPHHGPFGGKSAMETDGYAALETDEKVLSLLRELGHVGRFGSGGPRKADQAGMRSGDTGLLEPLSGEERETLLGLLEKLSSNLREHHRLNRAGE